MSFFQNTCKPSGLGGRLMVKMMNSGHAKLADWGFSQIQAKGRRAGFGRGLRRRCERGGLAETMPERPRDGHGLFRDQRGGDPKNQRRGHQSGSVRRGAGQRGGHAVSG